MFFLVNCRIVFLIFFLALVSCGGSEDRETEYFNRAKEHFDQGNYEKTRVEITNVLQINPKNTDARYLLAMLAEKDENWRKMYGLLLGIVEENPDFIEAQNKLGKLYLLSGQFDKAFGVVDFILAKDSNNAEALILQAVTYMRQGSLEKSEAILQGVLANNPSHIEAALILAKQYANNKQFLKAVAQLNAALKVNPDHLSLALSKINNLVSLNEFAKAETIFLEVIARFPDKSNLHYNLAKFYIAWGKIDQGEKVLQAYIELKPEEVQPKLMLVEYLLQKKGGAAAEKILHKFVQEDTENYDFRFALAKMYQQKPEQAISVLNDIVARDQNGIAGLKAKNLLALFAVEQGDRSQAYQLLDEIIENDSRNINALMLRSRLLVADNKLEAAIADLRVVLRENPDSEDAFVLSANAHLKRGYFDLAEDSLEKVLSLNPNNIEGRKNLARLLVRNRDDRGAIDILEASRLNQPDDDVLSMLVNLYIKTKSWDKAIELAGTIPVSSSALSAETHGKIYFAQQNYAQAVDEYLKALEINSTNVNIAAQLSNSYFALGQPEKAQNLLNNLVGKYPEHLGILNLSGAVSRQLKQFEKARLIFERIINLDGDFIPAYGNLASIHRKQKNYSTAISVYKQGLAKSSSEPILLIGLANAYEQTGDYNSAMEAYTLLLNHDKENKIAANNLAVLITKTTDDPERLKYALSLVKSFRNYKVPELLDTYGWLNYLNGEHKEALIALEKAVALEPDFAEFQYHLAMIYVENGRTEEAKLTLEKAISTSGDKGFSGIKNAREKLAELNN